MKKEIIKLASTILSYRVKLNNLNKQSLKKHIENIIEGKQRKNQLQDLFYNILTKGGWQIGQLFEKTKDFSKQDKEKYYNYLYKIFPLHNGTWAQFNANKEKSKKVDGKTYNYYLSLQFKDKNEVNKFLNSLEPLMKAVKTTSDKYNCFIAFKTHATLSGLLGHNDSLKFYCYDEKIKNQLQNLAKDYVQKYNLKEGKRLYNHGLDKQQNGNKFSFGQRLSSELTDIFVNWINKNKNKYNVEQFLQSFERDLDKWIENTAKKII